ncbi:MAG: glycosyltransferase family 4 protein [Candidatus Eisenbacteria sp.]|nr:glycosyltransferase family 4 protein [Candidatus Eisenbacteria bacterium]
MKKIAFVGNYLPRQCGIATFTHDLCEAVAEEVADGVCQVLAINDTPDGYAYPDRVRFEIPQNDLPSYRKAADFLNINNVDVVCLQHEYGIFGGVAGGHILELLRELRSPVVTTLHTALEHPEDDQRSVMNEIAGISDRLVVMSRRSEGILKDTYGIPPDKIDFIHHGIHDIPFVDPNYYKDLYGVEGRSVILTFGLLSPGKGIEDMIKAMSEVVKEHPDAVYIVLGATHPHVLRDHGEDYRLSLQRQVRELGLQSNVVFYNRFVDLEELKQFIGAADVYVTPYLAKEQAASGTLAYAVGAGKAVVSTPYWHAEELLAEGRGLLAPFRDPEVLAEQILRLLDNEVERHALRKRAYELGRGMVWREVARQYLGSFASAQESRASYPKTIGLARLAETEQVELPRLNLAHLRRMTDSTGILQHAIGSVPEYQEGYCTDDNARALVVVLMAEQISGELEGLRDLSAKYLAFLAHAYNPDSGRFRNFMGYDRRWLETEGSEDSHGRALWGLGAAVGHGGEEGQVAMAANLFGQAVGAVEGFRSPRAWAFAIIGVHEYLRRFSGDSEAQRVRRILASRLFELYRRNADAEWPWFEIVLSYANAKLPHALILSGQWMQDGEMVQAGLRSLEWLAKVQTSPEGYFSPVGSHDVYRRGGHMPHFDQQPIEAQAVVSACMEAYRMTQDVKWRTEARRAFEWFLGRNDLGLSVYDFNTGGCRDGVHPDRVNANQGAESLLAWQLSLLEFSQAPTSD